MLRSAAKSESGYILLTVLFMVVLILIALAVAAPRIATSIQRDREQELIHRGKQYTRAIKLYYKKFGRYPSSIDQLENTNNIRFLRKRYVDPMTGKDDWKIIHFGEAHVKAMGLFGQPIQNGGMSTTAGSSVLGGTPGLTSNPLGGAASSSSTTPSSSGITGSSSSGSSSTPGTINAGTNPTSPFSSTGSSTFGSGQTMGGAPIVGVASKSTKASIKEYKQQKHYNEWEFVYDPVEDLMSSVSLFGGGQSGSGNLNGPGSNGTMSPGTPSSPFSSGPAANPTSGTNPTSNPPTSPQ
ncbi:type II secretion system protein [Alloacidobacterium sp.]|uniref:type II secretion system protein n=1 Tax=Alloacidobacterium sp. TaxID=2951999 RepID=UPI002D240226|nr:type II secretion system protein [Alloacidobacterium sp.]HYK38089.1 type II secretion system protein [Alloacidobacterium sp.]